MTLPRRGSLPPPAVTFWGAARSVTGSMHLVEAGDRKVLLDCGQVRGAHDHEPPRRDFPFDPREIDAVVISHAHLDHCGNLPLLVHQGFAGPIWCTAATRELLGVMLHSSARFLDEDARVLSLLGQASPGGRSVVRRHDVDQALEQCVALSYGQSREIVPGMLLRLVDAGHILGSAAIHLTFDGPGRECSLVFTGDRGRRGVPFLHDPAPLPAADLVLCESTYGGKRHQTLDEMATAVTTIVTRTADRGGKVLVPVFSLGRTQVVVYYLSEWMRSGRLPRVPLHVDGSTTRDIADVYCHFREQLVPAAAEHWHGAKGDGTVHYIESREESEAISEQAGPAVILAPSGMCDGGRIVGHLKRHLDDPRCTIMLVSYQAPHTLGRQLLEPRPAVRLHGRRWNFWAEVAQVEGFSGHAGHDDLLDALAPLAGRASKVRLVHGEPERAEVLAGALQTIGFADARAPVRGERVSVV